MDLYNRFEALTDGFGTFLSHCHKHLLGHVVDYEWWSTITNGSYVPRTSPEGMIRSAIHWFIYRLIMFSINLNKEGDQVPKLDLFFVWCIITPNVFCNLPYFMAYFLTDKRAKSREGCPIYVGGGGAGYKVNPFF